MIEVFWVKINTGSKIALVACSNAQSKANEEKINELMSKLQSIGYHPVLSDFIYETDSYFSGTGQERANALMDAYRDDEVKAIFDISGGDIANEVLDYLDFDVIKNNNKPFFGYSDLTTIINAIYTMTGNVSGLYQIRNLVGEDGDWQCQNFLETFVEGKDSLINIGHMFIQEHFMEGIVIGGNIRCLLKLAGTKYMPDFTDKILLLEAYGSTSQQVMTYLTQLKQMGVFEKIRGVLLGTFTKLDAEIFVPSVEELVYLVAGSEIPVARTMDIGHGSDAKMILIGSHYNFD